MATIRVVQAEDTEGGKKEYEGYLEGVKEEDVDEEFNEILLRSFNEKARVDDSLSDNQASAMRFVPVGGTPNSLLQPTTAAKISGRLISYADELEQKIEKDEVIKTETEGIVSGCIKRTGESRGVDEIDFSGVKDNIKEVFSHLLPMGEIRNFPLDKLFIRLATGLAYTYNICKTIIKNVLGRFLPASVVRVICKVGGFLMQHLLEVGFYRILNDIGGWAKIAGSIALYTVLQGAVTQAAGGGTYKYVFAGVAVVGLSVATLCGGVAAYLHLKGA